MPLEFVKGSRGKDHLLHDGYRYVEDSKTSIKTTWNCAERRSFKCPARVHTSNGMVTLYKDNHNHTPDVAKIVAKKIVTLIKESSLDSTATPQGIIAEQTAGISESISASLPSVRAMARTIQRNRQVVKFPLAVPMSSADLVIPDMYKLSLAKENFLLFDTGATRDRIIIFGTTRNLELMDNCENWYADGTFKVSPMIFQQVFKCVLFILKIFNNCANLIDPFLNTFNQQLYTIHAVRQNNVIPLVFALLPDKTEMSYTRMLEALKNLRPSLNPKSIMTDFERAAKNAFRKVFPNAEQAGCFFHFGQCLWRKLQGSSNLQQQYKSDPDFQLKIKMFSALAFVPPPDVQDTFDIIVNDPFYSSSQSIEEFVDYFEDTWIGRRRRGGRRRVPMFETNEWNCYQRVLEDVSKTNNSVEGWHRAFSVMLGADHPTIWRLIEALQKEQSLNELKIAQYLSGQHPRQSRLHYRVTAERLKIVVQDYGNRSNLDYVKGVANNLNLYV